MEKIELRNSEAPLGHGHLYIVYTNKDGEEFIVRGGPGEFPFSFGRLDVEVGPYGTSSRDWVPHEERSESNNVLLLEGTDLKVQYLKMAFAAQLIEQSNSKYRTGAAIHNDASSSIVNSNSLVAASLASVGIDLSEERLPPSAAKWPPAGYKNKEAFEKPVAVFLSENFDENAAHDLRSLRAAYENLEERFVKANEGQLSDLKNYTNGAGDAFPKLLLEGIDWQATEQRIREFHKNDPSLAAAIVSDLALARTLRGDWEEEFRTKFGDLLVFENSPIGAPLSRGDLKRQSHDAPEPASSGFESNAPNEAGGALQRRTSYDRQRKLGRTSEEEAMAVDEYHQHLRESFVATDGHMQAAHYLAVRQFRQDWDLSAFAPDGEGTVMKNPVERAYPALEDGGGHEYIRKDVESILAQQGIRAARWYLSPNEMTGSDRAQGATDAVGYGPRMTLSYDDDAGGRHHVTDSFQANVWGASKQKDSQRTHLADPLGPDTDVPVPEDKPTNVLDSSAPTPNPHQAA